MANPVEYLQEKARRSTSVLLLKSHPPHARLSGGEEQTNKSATPRTPKSHPTNLPTLQSAYSNRPTTQKEEQKIQQQTKQQKWPQIECPKLPCCYNVPTHITICRRRQSSPELTTNKQNSIIIINRRAIHHHTTVIMRHQPSISSSRHSPGQQQPLPTGEQHRASPRFSKRSPHIKEIIISGKRICRFSAAAPSAQCIESPRSRPANETYQKTASHLILDKPHTHQE